MYVRNHVCNNVIYKFIHIHVLEKCIYKCDVISVQIKVIRYVSIPSILDFYC